MTQKNFITGMEFDKQKLQQIIIDALCMKYGEHTPAFPNKILTMIFANPSLRTRLSFESGMKKMGGKVNVISGDSTWEFEYEENKTMDGNTQEHIKEAAQVLSRYSDILALRKNDMMTKGTDVENISNWEDLRKDIPINKLAEYASKPVINMESNMYHPCQAMADIMTIAETNMSNSFQSYEKIIDIQNKKVVITWAPHPKPLPLATPHSQVLTPALFNMDVTLAHPEGFSLDTEVIEKAKEHANSFKISHNQDEACKNADIIIAKSWASLDYFGRWEEEKKYRKQFENWIVNKELMNKTNNAKFLHCLPVRRNVVVSDEVIESENSLVIDEAENRMWVQMAILYQLLQS